MTTVPTVQPRRLAPPIAFRNVARPLSMPQSDWERGYSFAINCDEQLYGHAYCDPTDLVTRRDVGEGENATVWPFWMTLALACDQPVVDPTELLAEQADTIEKATDWGLAHELWWPEWRLGNPADPWPLSLGMSPHFLAAAPSSSMAAAFSDLLDARFGGSCCRSTGAIWHLPPQLIPAALEAHQIVQVQNRYVGPMGYDVLTDAGYGPVSTMPDSTTWMWLTGPVRYAVGPVELTPDAEEARRWNPRRNRYEVLARRLAVVEVDPCCIIGAAVELQSPPEFTLTFPPAP